MNILVIGNGFDIQLLSLISRTTEEMLSLAFTSTKQAYIFALDSGNLYLDLSTSNLVINILSP